MMGRTHNGRVMGPRIRLAKTRDGVGSWRSSRGPAKGKQVLFSDRGEVDLKGFDEPVRLYEVRWRE